jgi:hypothetical protein
MEPRSPRLAVVLPLALFLAVTLFAACLLLPLAPCPWCDGEIKHFGGRLRHCDGRDAGCDGSGKYALARRWYWLLEYHHQIRRNRSRQGSRRSISLSSRSR